MESVKRAVPKKKQGKPVPGECEREKIAELISAGNEYDDFIKAVTHGLRNGLQTITGFSQTLCKFYSENLDETGKDCLDRIQTGTRKMKAVMDRLMELSNISGRELKREDVDLSVIAHSCLAELKVKDPNRLVECTIQPGLHAFADAGLARILLENLLGNAWKYTMKRAQARIEFGARPDGETPVFFVRDNGVGFDPIHAKAVFQPLQNFHKEENMKGAGVGLAMVKRIIQLHGGAVLAEGEKGRGAAFYFQFDGKLLS